MLSSCEQLQPVTKPVGQQYSKTILIVVEIKQQQKTILESVGDVLTKLLKLVPL